jgi:hypothetical protein
LDACALFKPIGRLPNGVPPPLACEGMRGFLEQLGGAVAGAAIIGFIIWGLGGGAVGWIVALVVGVLLFATSRLIARRPRKRGAVTSEQRPDPPSTRICAEDGPGDLEVCISEEDWQRVDYKALVLFAKVVIRNKTALRQQVTGYKPESPDFLPPDIEVMRAVERLRDGRDLPSGDIRPMDVVTGWVPFVFNHQPRGGRPEYDLVVEDAVRDEYRIHVPRRDPASSR